MIALTIISILGFLVVIGPFIHGIWCAYRVHNYQEQKYRIPATHPQLLPAQAASRIQKQPSKISKVIDRAIERAIEGGIQATPRPTLQKLQKVRITINEDEDIISLPMVTHEIEEEEPEEETIELEVEEEGWGEEIEEETIEEETIEEEEIEEETIELEPVRLDLSLEEQAERDPESYYDSIADILRRTVNYVESHDGIIVRDKGIAATSSDSYEIRQHERVSPQEWRHAFTHPKGIFWIAGILTRDAAGRTRLHPEHMARFEKWYERYLTPFREGLDEDDEEE